MFKKKKKYWILSKILLKTQTTLEIKLPGISAPQAQCSSVENLYVIWI